MTPKLIEPQETCGPCPTGVRFSGNGRVLIRDAKYALVWFKGGTTYVDRVAGARYGRACLQLLGNTNSIHGKYTELHEGGALKDVPWPTDPLWSALVQAFGPLDETMVRLAFRGDATLALAEKPWFHLLPAGYEDGVKARKASQRKYRAEALAKRNARAKLPAPKDFSETELEAIIARFQNDNETQGRVIAAKASVLLKHARVDRGAPAEG